MKNNIYKFYLILGLTLFASLLFHACEKSDSYDASGGTGIGGSLNRFTIIDSFLYILNENFVETYTIQGEEIQFNSRTQVDVDIETIFPFDSLLLIGGQLGMYVCKRTSTGSVEVISNYEHIQSCDPVVADGDLAYVTLSAGCNNQINQLDILDISDPFNPELLISYPMYNPLGLGIDGKWLFICDSSEGLKVYDRSNYEDLKLLHHFTHIQPLDVIPYQGLLFVMTAQGIHQFIYQDNNEMTEISSVSYL